MAPSDPGRRFDAEAAARRFAFLAEAGEALSSSLDYDQTLRKVAQLAIPVLGDFCIVDEVDDGVMRRVALAHVNETKAAVIEEMRQRHPPTADSPQPAARALRSGKPELLETLSPAVVAAHTLDDDHAALIRKLDLRSLLAVPLIARGTIVGVISLGITESDRHYDPSDVELAMELARRAALGIDNARLYRAGQREIEERRRVEVALRVSESRFRAVTEQSPLSMQVLAPNGFTIRVNKAWEDLWGIPFEALAAYNMLEDPQLEERGVASFIRRAFAGEAVEIPAIHYDPEQTIRDRAWGADPGRWVRAFAYPIKDDDGTLREVVLVHEDVSHRLRAEEATRVLADVGATLGTSLDVRVTLDNLARVIVPALADWCAVDVLAENGTLERVSAYHSDPVQVAALMELAQKYPSRRGNPAGAWHVIETGAPEWVQNVDDSKLDAIARDAEHLRLIRALRLTSYVSVPLIGREGPIGALTIAHAESKRRYRASDVVLAIDIGRRAANAVENARLYERLSAEDRRKDEFLAMLAHELRNPLAPLRSGLDVLRLSPTAAASEKTRAVMERQLSHLVRLVDDLLDMSRVTRGKIELQVDLVDIEAVVHAALEMSSPGMTAAGLEVTVRLPEDAVVLRGDPTRLAQVLTNVLVNATKFTPRGGHVTVEAARDKEHVVLRVKDDGIGIPRDKLGHVFDMFAQLGRAVGDEKGGLGIGLTLARRLVELHGGEVWAESEGVGHGTTLVIRLPAEATDSSAARQTSSRAAAPARATRRILVVDDNEDAAEMMATMLEMHGHEVRRAGSGPDALALVRDYVPDVALLDIGLPGMSGHELAEGLRALPALEGLFMVAVTGWGQEDDRRKSREAGFDRHLTKPVQLADLVALIDGLPPPRHE